MRQAREEGRRDRMTQRILVNHPKVGEIFRLRLRGDDGDSDPEAIMRQIGRVQGWAHVGHRIVGDATKTFMPVELDDCSSFDEVLDKLAQHGRIPEGQWIRSYKAAFRAPDSRQHIAIADATWVAPDGHYNFPYISKAGSPCFHRSQGSFGGVRWRWIVAI